MLRLISPESLNTSIFKFLLMNWEQKQIQRKQSLQGISNAVGKWRICLFPINDEKNSSLYEKYKEIADKEQEA